MFFLIHSLHTFFWFGFIPIFVQWVAIRLLQRIFLKSKSFLIALLTLLLSLMAAHVAVFILNSESLNLKFLLTYLFFVPFNIVAVYYFGGKVSDEFTKILGIVRLCIFAIASNIFLLVFLFFYFIFGAKFFHQCQKQFNHLLVFNQHLQDLCSREDSSECPKNVTELKAFRPDMYSEVQQCYILRYNQQNSVFALTAFEKNSPTHFTFTNQGQKIEAEFGHFPD